MHPSDRNFLRRKLRNASSRQITGKPNSQKQAKLQFGVEVTIELRNRLNQISGQEAQSRSSWIRQAVLSELENPPDIPEGERPRGYRVSEDDPFPKPKKVPLSYNVEPELAERMKTRAEMEDWSMGRWVLKAITNRLDNPTKEADFGYKPDN